MSSGASTQQESEITREDHVRKAFYRGESLRLQNHEYVKALSDITSELLREDAEKGDVTVESLGIGCETCAFEIRAKEGGVAAGIDEAKWVYRSAGVQASGTMKDGEQVVPGDRLLCAEGSASALFRLERVVVNLIQRMSGIATSTREMVNEIKTRWPEVHVIATRKTPWGLLDKKAVHAGGGGTHRLGLSDAILIKTNHLRLAREARGMMLDQVIQSAWSKREDAAFVEVEVTTLEEAAIAAGVFRELQAGDHYPCILMLDNFSPRAAEATVKHLRDHALHDAMLVEASGNIGKGSVADYAAAGVDAISVGALTHSVRALDVSARLISGPGDLP